MKRFYQHSRQTYARGAQLTPGGDVLDDVTFGNGKGEAVIELYRIGNPNKLRVVAYTDCATFSSDIAHMLAIFDEAQHNDKPLDRVCDALEELGYTDTSHFGANVPKEVMEIKMDILWNIEEVRTREDLKRVLREGYEKVSAWS